MTLKQTCQVTCIRYAFKAILQLTRLLTRVLQRVAALKTCHIRSGHQRPDQSVARAWIAAIPHPCTCAVRRHTLPKEMTDSEANICDSNGSDSKRNGPPPTKTRKLEGAAKYLAKFNSDRTKMARIQPAIQYKFKL